MKDIFISCSKEDKKFSKKLVSKLESAGYSCYVLPRDAGSGNAEKLINKSRILILILSGSAENSKEISEQLKTAAEKRLHIIPFKAGKVRETLGMKYMLSELEWVDAYGDGFDEAYEVLLEILEEITEGKKIKPVKKSSPATESFEIKKTHLYGVIAFLFAGLIYFAFLKDDAGLPDKNNFGQNNQTVITKNNNVIPDIVNKELKPEEQKITGSWKMTGYEDSRQMSPEERRQTEQSIEQMKDRVLLTFNADRSFSRAGFTPDVQNGYWEYDTEKKKIYLIPEGTNKKEEINIINLTDREMTFVVTESVEISPGNTEIVTTKLSFQKQ